MTQQVEKIMCNIQNIFLVSWCLPRRVNMLRHATASMTISMTTSNVQWHLNSAIQATVACYGKVLNTHPGVRPWYYNITNGGHWSPSQKLRMITLVGLSYRQGFDPRRGLTQNSDFYIEKLIMHEDWKLGVQHAENDTTGAKSFNVCTFLLKIRHIGKVAK